MSRRAPRPGEGSCAAATSGRYRVVERRSFGPYALLTLLAPDVAAVALPGQFVMVAVPGTQFHLRRPLSLHSVEGRAPAPAGRAARRGHARSWPTWASPTLSLAGPLGTGFPLDGVRAALLVGGGIGTAPLQFVADALRARGVPVTAAFGFRDEAPGAPGRRLRDRRALGGHRRRDGRPARHRRRAGA